MVYTTDPIFIVEKYIRKRTRAKWKERFIRKCPDFTHAYKILLSGRPQRHWLIKHVIARSQCSQMRSLKTVGLGCRYPSEISKTVIRRDRFVCKLYF